MNLKLICKDNSSLEEFEQSDCLSLFVERMVDNQKSKVILSKLIHMLLEKDILNGDDLFDLLDVGSIEYYSSYHKPYIRIKKIEIER